MLICKQQEMHSKKRLFTVYTVYTLLIIVTFFAIIPVYTFFKGYNDIARHTITRNNGNTTILIVFENKKSKFLNMTTSKLLNMTTPTIYKTTTPKLIKTTTPTIFKTTTPKLFKTTTPTIFKTTTPKLFKTTTSTIFKTTTPKLFKTTTSTILKTTVFKFQNGRVFLFPERQINTEILSVLSADKRSEFVQRIVNPHDAVCSTHRRFGDTSDGGWDMCLVGPYKPEPNCIVMSFGINSEWSFDDEIGKTFRCQVYAFDPSMKMKDHRRNKYVSFYSKGISGSYRQVKNLGTVDSYIHLLELLGVKNKNIDLLKMDVEWSEWDVFKTAFADGSLHKVKQLAVEFHTSQTPSVAESLRIQFTLNNLYTQGFRAWNFNWNLNCTFRGKNNIYRTQCNEVYFINTRFLPNKK